jgi:hypothetical protein
MHFSSRGVYFMTFELKLQWKWRTIACESSELSCSRALPVTNLSSLPLGNIWKQNKLATTSTHSRLQRLKSVFVLKLEKLSRHEVVFAFASVVASSESLYVHKKHGRIE